jgi:hypothetical protein
MEYGAGFLPAPRSDVDRRQRGGASLNPLQYGRPCDLMGTDP